MSDKGRVIVAARNTALQLPHTKRWRTSQDDFRKALETVRCSDQFNHIPAAQATGVPLLTEEQVSQGFEDAGFRENPCKAMKAYRAFRMTMDDRLWMWKVPAVLGSLVDEAKMSLREQREFAEAVADQLASQDILLSRKTISRIVKYWVFWAT